MADLEHSPQPDAISRASIFGVERVENQRTRRKIFNRGRIRSEEVIGVKEELNAGLTPTLGFHNSKILGFAKIYRYSVKPSEPCISWGDIGRDYQNYFCHAS